MKKCKNCSKQRQSHKNRKTSAEIRIVDEYGIAKIASDPRIVICNDQYMLELLFKNQKKTNKLNKQVNKIKQNIRDLQTSLEKSKRSDNKERSKHSNESPILQYQEAQVRKRAVSKTVSVSSSKNRQVGRFTRVSQGQPQSFSKHSLKEEVSPSINDSMKGSKIKNLFSSSKSKKRQRSGKTENQDFVSFSKKSKQASQNYLISPLKTHTHKSIGKYEDNKLSSNHKAHREDILKYIPTKDLKQKVSHKDESTSSKKSSHLEHSSNEKSQHKKKKSIKNKADEKSDFDKYMPTYQQVESSLSNLLMDGQNEDSSQILSQKTRLQRQFQELVIQQKNATLQQRKVIREQIHAISQMLKNLSD